MSEKISIPHWATYSIHNDVYDLYNIKNFDKQKWNLIEDRIIDIFYYQKFRLRPENKSSNWKETLEIYFEYMHYRRTKQTLLKKKMFKKLCGRLSREELTMLSQRQMTKIICYLDRNEVISAIINPFFFSSNEEKIIVHIPSDNVKSNTNIQLWNWMKSNVKNKWYIDYTLIFNKNADEEIRVFFEDETDASMFKLLF
jgi:hypothetical protein